MSVVVGDVVLALRSDGDGMSPQTLARLVVLMAQFAGCVERGHGVGDLSQVDAAMVAGYLVAPTSDGVEPGVSLRYFRRLAVRVLFRTCRQLGMQVCDPTVD